VKAGVPQFAVGPSYGDTGTELFGPYDATKVSVAAVPEPATWVMMLIGMAALGIAVQQRRLLATQGA
jgi:PEP-CTERM motif